MRFWKDPVKKIGNEWWYDFGNHKYRRPIPEARTKYEAEQAEIKIKRDVFEGKYGKQFGTMLLANFVGDPNAANEQFGEGTFLDQFRVRAVLRAFAGKTLGEITPAALRNAVQPYALKGFDCNAPASEST